ncbi:response regulator, partial [Faecalicatena contorta]|uniref:response regulator n=1 Tax=Faecalicatena contorta TaxID=39482 RepID=UPI0031D4F35D
MKLMIIDDEKIIREGIHYSISWGKIGIDIVKDYSGGEEALKDFPEFLPDIVISDVKMEEMNGLEFFSEAKKIKNNLKIISDCRQNGFRGYTLKPFCCNI